MNVNRIGIGFIGGGFITKFHIQSLVGVRDCDAIGVMSRTKESAEESAALARTLGVGDAKAFDSITDMVADPNINALWICAPNFTRIEIMEEIVAAIERGIDWDHLRKTFGPKCKRSKESFGIDATGWTSRWLFGKPGFCTFYHPWKRDHLGSWRCNNRATLFSSGGRRT